ncbi:helix-turn-helix domain-containing protein, partial [Citrobacter sp. Awk 4]|uniref:helix-turn-helix domain-containing protein n=1 Tax=Citrobacter sp. Awk 4 TaxID=2963955 RepID=UPI00230439C6
DIPEKILMRLDTEMEMTLGQEKQDYFKFLLEVRPIEVVDKLIKKLISFSTPIKLPVQQPFYITSPDSGKTSVLLLQKGCFFWGREKTPCKSGIHLALFLAPTIIGLIDVHEDFSHIKHRSQYYILPQTECIGYSLPASLFSMKISEYNLWHDVNRILAHQFMILNVKVSELVGADAYTKVRTLLTELWLYPEEIRQQINVQSFIQVRTLLSRSQTFKILAELKAGNYIKIKQGALFYLRKLPTAY